MKRSITLKLMALVMAAVMVLSTMGVVFATEVTTKAGVESLTFEELADGTLKVTLCDFNASGSIAIPSQHNGKKVTQIGEGAFFGCDLLTQVTIPDTVVSIGAYAFENCKALQTITVPDSVTNIGDRAFALSGLTKATIGSGAKNIGAGVFASCENLKEISVASSNGSYI